MAKEKIIKENIDEPIIKEDVVEETPKIIKEDVVEVKRSDFDRMIKQMEKQAKDIELLYKTADKDRLSKELNKGEQNLIRQAKISLLDDSDKMIVGWSDLKTNRCEVVLGRWVEEQSVDIVLDNGEVIPMTYLESCRRTTRKILADIIGTNDTEENGVKKTMYKMQLPSGKVLLINKIFLNRN